MTEDDDLLRLMTAAAGRGAIVLVHAENGRVIDHLGRLARRGARITNKALLRTAPGEIEADGIFKSAMLSRLSGCTVLFVHLTSKPAAEILAWLQSGVDGDRLHAETQPHYLLLTNRKSGSGYDLLHVAVDDHTRLVYVEVHGDERGATCAAFVQRASGWFAQHGVRVQRVLTDNAMVYRTSRAFAEAVADLGARHRRIRPYRPQTSGKVERFHQTMTGEWAHSRPYGSNRERLDALDIWLRHYNTARPHSALKRTSPMQTLQHHVRGKHT